ncbi:hypothetical protein AMTR_s00057p00190250 [Amborella trichopoda]|uniref:F-box domain-containing protein n=1 Tax=Amborella trichopoda TaxID=13333 RepID=U5D967_AMBTC|nr:hypothetical protein AMTR_s00057p00190250 [Amborella trichopoda]
MKLLLPLKSSSRKRKGCSREEEEVSESSHGLRRLRISKNEGRARDDGENLWSEIPFDILRLILERLTMPNSVRAAAVCKHWARLGCSNFVKHPPMANARYPGQGQCVLAHA